MNAKQILEQVQTLLKAAKENPEQFKELTKTHERGVHQPVSGPKDGNSSMGNQARGGVTGSAKISSKVNLSNLKDLPKPNLPKAEMTKEERTAKNQMLADIRDKKIKKSDIPKDAQGGAISAEGVKKGDVPTDTQGGAISSEKSPAQPSAAMQKDAMAPAVQPAAAQSAPAHASNVAHGDESLHHALKILDTPDKQKAMLAHLRTIHEGAQSTQAPAAKPAPAPASAPAPAMKAEDVLNQARTLLKAAKDDPKAFEELTKAFGAAPAAPAMAKPAVAAPAKPAGAKPPGMGQPPMPKPAVAAPAKPAGMRMTKDEIKADLAKPWKPKHMKQGC